MIGGASAALAAPPAGSLGSGVVTPATGNDITVAKVHTSAGCSTDSNAYNATITGPGAFAAGFLIADTQNVGFSTTGGFDVQLKESFKDAATDLSTTLQAGEYDITVNCVDDFSLDVKGTFTTAVYFTSPTAYVTSDPNAPVTTSTSLTTNPAGSATQGNTVTLTASVTPASAGGTVQFKDGATNLGSPVTVVNGVATFSTAALTSGSHSLSAVFTGATANVQGSTGTATIQINAPVATPTSTSLTVNPSGTTAQYSTVQLSAGVTPAGAAGAIQFTDNGANFGAPVTLSGGTATLSTSGLAAGAHSFTAKFVPANAAAYTGSESAAAPLTVTPFAGVTASEQITTTVTAGALVISVANTNVTLPSPTLTADASKLTTAGELNPITVTDTRAGNPGWNVSGQVNDFADGQSHAINGGNLGWTPKIVNKLPVQNITAGPAVQPADAIQPGATPGNGLGIASSRTLATAAAQGGTGTANLGADLALNVPTSTVAGTYTATLTLTAI
ncbi:Ig-like domain repeat protein [Pseudonocardiaceae bacterium YIM PH 21723]|nr:Ig-like domain repeat protein [Pseudonocardiaceae bacterium YIM PH 21723]